MESGEQANCVKARATMDLQIGWPGAHFDFKKPVGEEVQLFKTSGLYLLVGRSFPPQAGHNNFEHVKTTKHGYFFLATEEEKVTILVCLSSHHFVDYSESDKALSVKDLKLEDVVIERYSFFSGHVYVQHTGAD